MIRTLLFLLMTLSFSGSMSAKQRLASTNPDKKSVNGFDANTYEPTDNGIIARYNSEYVRIQFYNDSTVRVSKAFDDTFEHPRWSIIREPDASMDITITEADGVVKMNTSKMHIDYALATGRIIIYDANGNQLFKESSHSFTKTTDGPFSSYTITQRFLLDKNECIYGMGQLQDGLLNRRGTNVKLEQKNCSICIPYFLSSKNYGFYWDNYSPTTFSDTGSDTFFRSTGKVIDYYVWSGSNSHEVQRSLRNMTGQTELPPLWNFGLYQSKERYASGSEVMNVVKRFRELHIPLDCIVQDWQYWGDGAHWNAMEFLNPEYSNYRQMISYVHNRHAKLMISIWPNFGPATNMYSTLNQKGLLFTVQDVNGSHPYNPYNSEARALYWDYLWSHLGNKGIDAYWMDATEPEFFGDDENHMNNIALEGQTWRSLRNAYPLATVSGVADHFRAQPELSDTRVSIMTRSAYLGMQRTGAFIWSADIDGDWATLRKQIPAACNVSETGLPYWNSDTGGFFKGDLNNDSWRRLFVRWTQFSTFTPMLRFHGTSTAREPWRFGSAGDSRGEYDNIVRYIKLRYALLPYLYSTAHKVRTDAATFMQGMPIAFPHDANTLGMTDQYMFGHSFLVAPVLEDGVIGRNAYLPKGERWIDFWTGYTFNGGQAVFKVAPMELIPLYVRAGSILPIGPDVQYSTEKKWDNLEIRVYPGADGEFTLYEDEFDNYNYEKGQYTEIPMTWNEATKTLNIGARRGSYNGMLSERTFNIVVVSPEKGTGDKRATTFDATIAYTGEAVSVSLEAENVPEPVQDDVPSSISLVYPTSLNSAQPVKTLEDGVEYAIQNANNTLVNRRFFWDQDNLRTQGEGKLDDLRVVANRSVINGEECWSFRITSTDYDGRYIGRNNDVNVQVSDEMFWKATYEESSKADGDGFKLVAQGDDDNGLQAMMMNGDGTWVVAWKSGDPGSDYTPLTTHWQFFRTKDLISGAMNQYNTSRLLLYQYLREAMQQYSRGISTVIPAYNSGIKIYNDVSSSIEDVNSAIENLREAIASTVSLYEVGVPATYGILNQGFENLSTQKDVEMNSGVMPPFGWTVTRNGREVTPNQSSWYWGAINSDGGSYMEGGHVFGVWNGSSYGNIELSQTLTGLPNGKWRLTALVMNNHSETGNLTRLFLNSSSMLSGSANDYSTLPRGEECTFSGEWSNAADDMHQRFTVESTITDGTLHFGIRSNGFFKADDFQLTWLGEESSINDKEVELPEKMNMIYDLSGRRVSTPDHGIYIINGKKVKK